MGTETPIKRPPPLSIHDLLLVIPTRVLQLLSPLWSGHQVLDTLIISLTLFQEIIIWMKIQSFIEGEDRLWTSSAAPVACLFWSKVMCLLNIMLMLWFYNEPLLSGQPPLSCHLTVPQRWQLNGGSTVP